MSWGMTLFTAFTLSQMALWSLIDLLASIPPKIEISPKEWEGYRDDYTQFSLNYFKVAIYSAPSRNVLVSPLSFGMILSMIHQGTYGESSDQISKVMGLTQEESRKIFYNITHSLRSKKENLIMDTINGAYFTKLRLLQENYKKILTTFYDANMTRYDGLNVDQAVKALNKDIETRTNGDIQEFFTRVRTRDPTIYWPIPKSGALILGRNQQIGALFNTIYLHGDWKYKFNERATRKSNFQVDTIGTKILVDMMYLKGVLRGGFDRELEINWIELPYNNENLLMIIILPIDKSTEINVIMKQLTPSVLQRILDSSHEFGVSLFMPAFFLRQKESAKEYCKRLGIVDIFTKEANFNQATDSFLVVKDIYQEIAIEVSEQGKEKPITFVPSPMHPAITFNVDHPFVFITLEKRYKIPLFMGKIVRPSV